MGLAYIIGFICTGDSGHVPRRIFVYLSRGHCLLYPSLTGRIFSDTHWNKQLYPALILPFLNMEVNYVKLDWVYKLIFRNYFLKKLYYLFLYIKKKTGKNKRLCNALKNDAILDANTSFSFIPIIGYDILTIN